MDVAALRTQSWPIIWTGADHIAAMSCLHHHYTVASTIDAGDLLADAMRWTGATAGEVLGALQGTAQIRRGFAAGEPAAAGNAITASGAAAPCRKRSRS